MNDRDWSDLRAHLAWPETPDVVRRVAPKLDRREPALRAGVAAVVVGLTIAVLAIVSMIGVERVSAFFGIGGVTLQEGEPVDTLAFDQGEPIDPGSITVPLPVALGDPSEVSVDEAGRLWVLYPAQADRPEVIVTVFDSVQQAGLAKLLEDPGVQAELVTVGESPAYWIAGSGHFLLFRAADGSLVEDQGRMSAAALVWTVDEATYRIEGDLTRTEAIEIAESLR